MILRKFAVFIALTLLCSIGLIAGFSGIFCTLWVLNYGLIHFVQFVSDLSALNLLKAAVGVLFSPAPFIAALIFNYKFVELVFEPIWEKLNLD
jgi:hypothetical protein